MQPDSVTRCKHTGGLRTILFLVGNLALPALLELTFVNNMFIFGDMITSFANKETEKLFATGKSKKLPPEIIIRSIMRLTQLDSACDATDLLIPQSNRLETLSGDRAGGFAVIKDVVKTQVFKLAQWRNAHDPYGTGANPIPRRIITRAPSAELRADQKDQDSLPAYEVLDLIVQRYMENDEGIEALVADGFERADVEKVTRLIKLNEYKRRQAPPGVRVTTRAFGRDWRYPITSQFRA